MPIPAPTRLPNTRRPPLGFLALLGWGLLVGCQPQQDQAEVVVVPPVGHYEGSFSVAGQPEVRAALDIRHPSPGHYEAEFMVPTVATLSFAADTIVFTNSKLQLTRPARVGQTLQLTQDGDFWRGSLTLDSTKASIILLKRGAPSPTAYRVEEVPQANGSAWLFAPADTGTLGAALALLPDAETAPTAAIWADALAREGIIVLLLPATDSADTATETPRLQAALRFLHGTAGADTTQIGAWAVGNRMAALAPALVGASAPRVAFLIAQNTAVSPYSRTALRELGTQKLPILGLYSGPAASTRANALRIAVGGRRSTTVRAYRATGPDLLVPEALSPRFGSGLPNDVLEWLRGK
jgi:hypothetical protein